VNILPYSEAPPIPATLPSNVSKSGHRNYKASAPMVYYEDWNPKGWWLQEYKEGLPVFWNGKTLTVANRMKTIEVPLHLLSQFPTCSFEGTLRFDLL
jgi:hypothetical protein